MTADNNEKNSKSNDTLDNGDAIEVNRGVVITVVITFQAMFFIYTAGDELSLDMLPSLLLAFVIGIAVAAVILVLSRLFLGAK